MNPIFQVVQNAMPPILSHPEALATLPPSHANASALMHGTLDMPPPPHRPRGGELALPRESGVSDELVVALPGPSGPPSSRSPPSPQRPHALVLREEDGLVDPVPRLRLGVESGTSREIENASVASTLETRSMDGSVLSYEAEHSHVGSSLSTTSSSSASLQSRINAKLKPQSTLQQYASSPRHLPHGYASLHRRRIVTNQAVWPLKDAEDRIKPSYDEDLLRTRMQRKYGPSISKRYRAPVVHVPWSLLDELEAERVKWEGEKGRFDRHIRERMLAPLYGRGVKASAAGIERDKREQALLEAQREEEERQKDYFARPRDEASLQPQHSGLTEEGAGKGEGEEMLDMSVEGILESSIGEITEAESITNITTSTASTTGE